MKKRIIVTLFFLFAGIGIIYCQPTNSDFSNALASLGLSNGLAAFIVSILAVLIGKFWPQKWTDPLAIVIKFAKVLIIALEWLNDKVNNGTKAQKYKTIKQQGEIPTLKSSVKKAWLTIGMLVAILVLPTALSAQSPWKGFWKPVTAENFTLMKGDGKVNEFVFRPTVDISATQTYIVNKEVKTEPLIGAGVGVSYLHYKDITTVPYNDYGINALALFNMTDAGNVTISPALTFSYQKIAAGAYYNFADKRLAVLTGIVIKF